MSRNRSFLYRFRLPLKLFGVIILTGVCLTGAFYLTKLGPGKVDRGNVYMEFDEVEGNKLLELSQQKEEYFRNRAEQRAPTEEDYAALDEAIKALSDYLDMRGGHHTSTSERREELYALRDNYRGKVLYEESLLLEDQCEGFEESGQFDEALKAISRATFLQRKLNETYDRSPNNDKRRVTRLQRKVDQLTAKPLYEDSVQAEDDAKQALAAEDFDRAKLFYQRAIELQTDLNMRFRGLQFANVQRVTALEQELSSLESSDLYERIGDYRAAAEEAEAKEDYAAAAEAYQNAFRLQRELNREFPQSRFAGALVADELQGLRENALSRNLGDGILEEMQRLDEALRERTAWRAIEIIRALYPKVQQFTEQFPRSTILGEDALLKMQYLSAIEDDIGFLQDRIYGQLLSIEGNEDWRMLRTEVSQALYMSVMLKANPSRHVGDLLPVDSCNWDEAKDFCQRVSWILGHDVRLPNEDEFYAAIGSLRYVNLREVSWNLENADGVTHEIGKLKPNGQGFCDLLGNVAEWLESGALPGEGEAYIGGGSVETPIDILIDVPVEISNRRMRNRFAGFRFVVYLPNL
ncbi:formylglycine-generating enzyme family protein [Cerasicoccus maritimus]|uniref:formylglycine-generating enzyme family protein n=1 Tax=Cerasicoccus maritimus TaxID=490089 RepID=UPI002852A965|nr:SUMF1/EgtB/PvdO family nonheme iron enzyme [Cerasicoccus maritimus]